MGVGNCVIEFFGRLGLEKEALRISGTPLGVQRSPPSHSGHLVHIAKTLGVRLLGLVVPDVREPLVADGPDPVVSLVHAVPRREDILARSPLHWPKERRSLHPVGDSCPGNGKHRRTEVDEAYKTGAHGTRLQHAGPANDQWHTQPGIVNPALRPRQPPAMDPNRKTTVFRASPSSSSWLGKSPA